METEVVDNILKLFIEVEGKIGYTKKNLVNYIINNYEECFNINQLNMFYDGFTSSEKIELDKSICALDQVYTVNFEDILYLYEYIKLKDVVLK